MKQFVVKYEPEYISFIYTGDEINQTIKSIMKQLMPLWKKGKAFGCLCPENITLIQKDHMLYGEVDLKTMFVNPDYDCPEKQKTPASDIFSLGLIFHEMLTMSVPYCMGESDTVREALLNGERVDVSDYMDDLHYNLISSMIECDPEKRISYRELLASLESGKFSRRYRRDHDGTAYVNVELKDDEGNPAKGVMITVMHIYAREEFFDACTDEEGKAELVVSSGECWFSTFAEEYRPIDKHFFVYAEDTVTFRETMHKRDEDEERSFIYDDDDEIPFE